MLSMGRYVAALPPQNLLRYRMGHQIPVLSYGRAVRFRSAATLGKHNPWFIQHHNLFFHGTDYILRAVAKIFIPQPILNTFGNIHHLQRLEKIKLRFPCSKNWISHLQRRRRAAFISCSCIAPSRFRAIDRNVHCEHSIFLKGHQD